MSKIGKKPIEIPNGVTVKIEGDSIFVKGPKGELTKPLVKGSEVIIEGNLIRLSPKGEDNSAKWGLQRALIANMVIGVTNGFNKILEFQGIGYKANAKEGGLELGLGFSHPVTISAVEGIMFSVEKNSIKISGLDKELVGKVAAEIRSKRPPEPYKGSGIRYKNEIIKKKAGKKAVAAG
ncbi:MAG: 50S ribosomal protein L6 [Candidatus Yanofskybacteria bacterium RIFCSPHIGHO2_01_FULL_42_12]|uniref:Large ribosomal subunit protein uL6 n=1 Tax=Candidatus Yanofskybacteria bacterium RIFCSPLOWO2_01_FULL_42_49 TaxID=1802694 RepID=A0A1F8GDR5_9BACT|nr:MAG: 50S ribosomal protein L6 [Candidatus Yanofskybacteria bacterium RIFCSPHIGHO2_01_FULL_42_12]OGN23473.1 MAG: 50S ribosomal protein L6 [Candidatus Yanofskybacteria bacterium RIFCSPLOWO2_01_FULL_42_49]